MINAWSLAGSILAGTFEKDYPVMDKTKGRWSDTKITPNESDEYDIPHSDSYYDYTRNDSNAKNPFTDPVDRARADYVVGGGNTDNDLDWIARSGGFEWTPGSPWPPSVPDEDDGLDYEVNYYGDYMADIDDQRAHHFGYNTVPPYITAEFKYNEDQILKTAEEYIAKTYTMHYTGKKGTQTLDLIESIGDAEAFCRSNAIKYLSRFGKKDGKSKSDLLKAIHYCTLLYHFSDLTNESNNSNETI
tara:strand:- start:474 stop:1208 length:735 start_codon:yes stop_codon:yes gene_type:complete